MNEKEFIESLGSHGTLLKKHIASGTPDTFALSEYNALNIVNKSKVNKSVAENLIENYSFSSDFQIMGGIWFKEEIESDEDYIRFGCLDADDLVVDKKTGVIKLVESGTMHEMDNCAESIESFLDVLSYLVLVRVKSKLADSLTPQWTEKRDEIIQTATSLAGGESYKQFYEFILGDY